MTSTFTPLKHLAGINERTLPETTDPDHRFRYIDIGAVGRGELVAQPEEMRFEDAPSRARRLVRAGDTIVSTVRTYLRAVWPVPPEADELVVSTGFAVLTPRRLDARYFSWWVRSDRFIEEIVARSVGVSYPAINPLEIGELLVRVPSRAEQRAIAAFLDIETARIDALITKKCRMIDLLHERHWGLLENLARAGAPNQSTALKHLTLAFTDGDWIEAPYITSTGIRLIQTGNIGRGVFRDQGDKFISDETFVELNCTEVYPGDVLISRLANTVGQACIAPDLGCRMVASVDVVILRPNRATDAQYLVRYMSSERHLSRARLDARGTTMQRLARSQVGELPVPVIGLDLQRRLVDATDRAAAPLMRAIARLEQQIALLREHRQALISAAVTGELEVPRVEA